MVPLKIDKGLPLVANSRVYEEPDMFLVPKNLLSNAPLGHFQQSGKGFRAL